MSDFYEPTHDELDYLNSLEGVAGSERPDVEHEQYDDREDWPGRLYPDWQMEIEQGDHLRIDEQGWE